MVKSKNELGSYLTKYLGKGSFDDRFSGHRSYFCSGNLTRPRKYYSDKVSEFTKFLDEEGIKPDFESKYENEYSGTTKHFEYHLSAPFDQHD